MGGEVVQTVLRLKEREGRKGAGGGGGEGSWWWRNTVTEIVSRNQTAG